MKVIKALFASAGVLLIAGSAAVFSIGMMLGESTVSLLTPVFTAICGVSCIIQAHTWE